MAYYDYIGMAAALVGLVALVPYIQSIFASNTEPSPISWLLWTASAGILAASYYAMGAGATIWLSLVYVVNPLIIFVLSLKYGRMRLDWLDWSCVAGLTVSMVIWLRYDSPGSAMAICLVLDALGAAPTIKKIWHEPGTENKPGWVLITIAAIMNLVAIDALSFEIIVYPVYAFLMTSLITLLLFRKQAKARILTG